jgi:hypothetical protein
MRKPGPGAQRWVLRRGRVAVTAPKFGEGSLIWSACCHGGTGHRHGRAGGAGKPAAISELRQAVEPARRLSRSATGALRGQRALGRPATPTRRAGIWPVCSCEGTGMQLRRNRHAAAKEPVCGCQGTGM